MNLLKQLCAIHAPSGSEWPMTEFILSYVEKQQKNWKKKPKVLFGDEFQDGIILVFGKPKTAVFTHIDSVGFTVRYGKQLVKIGGPKLKNGYQLVGADSKGEIECILNVAKNDVITYKYKRLLETGTTLTFKPIWRETKNYIQCCYLDNRIGVYNALKLAETLENGIICFTCWEEHGGGSAEMLGKYIYEKYAVKQALISDITWVTEGVKHGKGVVISIRDSGIPRRKFVNKIIELAKESKIPFQLEVESAGGSDGNALQRSPYPFDWCFIGAPESNVHSPDETSMIHLTQTSMKIHHASSIRPIKKKLITDEKVHKKDIDSMLKLYRYLMNKL